LRLRPILMTSFAFILGILPLYFASGAGKLGRHSVGTAIVGGMLFSTILNLFFIPVLYVIVKTVLTSFRKRKGPGTSHDDDREVIGRNGQMTERELKVS
jgi:hydrophobic/amphiphilic exporter-1 (mainly G- bacteria), HAE1 family